jgi:hypothetical protein
MWPWPSGRRSTYGVTVITTRRLRGWTRRSARRRLSTIRLECGYSSYRRGLLTSGDKLSVGRICSATPTPIRGICCVQKCCHRIGRWRLRARRRRPSRHSFRAIASVCATPAIRRGGGTVEPNATANQFENVSPTIRAFVRALTRTPSACAALRSDFRAPPNHALDPWSRNES